MTAREAFRRLPLPRMWHWYLLTIGLVFAIAMHSPQQLPIVVYKVMMLTLACALAHTIDTTLFHHEADQAAGRRDTLAAARVLSRALVFVGTVLGVTLGI